ncbi:AF4/FMR2 family member lilli [Drosophila obscura]|uniref:AF4/FMR2 family member lilli n=1 Tax=Drosophila obscura TaxID=7282 RepID=UPI001BB0DD35|nr:AF4/FMR2 family member lilli [Drosophila obscura]
MALNHTAGGLAFLGLASLALALLPFTTAAQAQVQAQTLSRSVLPAQPADHLVPPPLPTAQRLSHAAGYSEVAATGVAAVPEPPPGFMTRVARWFGLGGQTARDQQLSASSANNYAYPKPVQSFDAAGKPCSLCNKYPWVPMVGQQQQQQQQTHPQHQQQQQQQQQQQPQQQVLQSWQVQQQPLAQASQHRQRAVQFRAPPAATAGQSVFLPITVPLPALSHVALPPLYNAQPFRPLGPEHVAAPSEVRASTVPPFRPAPSPRPYSPSIASSSSNFEIVQSHQLTDFVTSVEYPATFVPSHAIDVGGSAPFAPAEQQQQADREQQQQQQQQLQLQQDISTVRYQLEDLSSGTVHQHLPASQLLTELGHFAETTTQQLPPADNYPAASSQQQLQQEQEQQLFYAEQYQPEETSTVVYSTTEQPTTGGAAEAAEAEAAAPPAPFLELNNHLAAVHHRGVYQQQQQQHPHRAGSRGRETPKRLLDSPINHAPPLGVGLAGGARPFTRDPADLSFRLSQVYKPTPTPAAPTPTSTYGAIDASGQYAGMSPPSPQQVIIPYTTKQRPRPFDRPWVHVQEQQSEHHDGNDVEEEPHEQQESKLAAATVTAPPPPNTHRTTKYLTKILATNLRELLKRERETKRRPLGVDISRLQHNIDGWTEQEYNSLSHRPSTPTIRGRSKHIPTEYLTTTTTTPAPATAQQLTRQSKTTRGGGFELGGAAAAAALPTSAGDLSTSINNLEQLHLLGERGLRRFQPLEDNRLHLDYYEAQQRPGPRPRPGPGPPAMTTPLPSTTTTGRTTGRTTMMPSEEVAVTPLYVRSTQAPTELWKQARVAILPQTNEKVYVVTPQPRHQAYHATEGHREVSVSVSAAASAPRPVYQQTPAPAPAPRFPRVRPTPGTAKAATPTLSSSQLHNYTPDIFGLTGLSAYVPADPVEIIDGNSKVITIVTAAPTAAALQRPTAKPTMSPSPR